MNKIMMLFIGGSSHFNMVEKYYSYYFTCSRRSDSGGRAKNKASERAGKNEGRLGERARERL